LKATILNYWAGLQESSKCQYYHVVNRKIYFSTNAITTKGSSHTSTIIV